MESIFVIKITYKIISISSSTAYENHWETTDGFMNKDMGDNGKRFRDKNCV